MSRIASSNTGDGIGSQQDAQVEQPYVGLRPYEEKERHLFFGRDHDADRLCNKIFAGPLTVLYAPSGVGKSSLLVTLVVPALRAQECVVMYMKDWPDDNACDSVKRELLSAAEDAGIPVSLGPDSPLTDIVAAVTSSRELSVVLILDQFEAFLSKSAGDPGGLRHELAALVRSDLPAHIVLSLRQEFLAALEPFREHILSLFRSTYHLMHLSATGAEDAINKPAEMFGRTCEAELVEALLHDLRADAPAEGDAETGSTGIDLPLLQIICQRIWRDAEVSGERSLTLAAYRELGGRHQIIRGYVQEVVSSLPWQQRGDVARVLNFLAPHSGTKVPFATDDLRHHTRLSRTRTWSVLELLSGKRVVRQRNDGGRSTFELYHDAFIGIIRPEVDRILTTMRRRRWMIRGALIPVGIGLVAIIVVGVQKRAAERERTDGLIEKLRKKDSDSAGVDNWTLRQQRSTAVFDQVATYLVGKGDKKSLARLERILTENREFVLDFYRQVDAALPNEPPDADRLLPRLQTDVADRAASRDASFGIIARTSSVLDRDMMSTTAPVVRVPGISRDTSRILGEWTTLAPQLAQSLSVPIPEALNVSYDRRLPAGSLLVFRVASDTVITREVPVPSRDSTFVTEAALTEEVRQYFFGSESSWRKLDSRLPGGPYRVVPRWTVPIWKAAGHQEMPRATVFALAMADRALQHPELLLTRDALRAMMLRISADVGSPWLATTDEFARVHSTLVEFIKQGGTLKALPYQIDVVAHHPWESSADLAQRLRTRASLHFITSPPAPARITLGQNRASGSQTAGNSFEEFRESVVWPPHYAPVRINGTRALVGRLRDTRSGWSDSSAALRADLIRRLGIEVPKLEVLEDSTLESKGRLAYRVEVLTDTVTAVQVVDSLWLPQLIGELRVHVAATRVHWVSGAFVKGLIDDLPVNLRQWLQGRFSEHDLKLLLRQVLIDDGDGIHVHGADSSHITNASWLFQSIVFWEEAGGLADLNEAASLLRRSQQARVGWTAVAPARDSIGILVSRGIEHLRQDQIPAASAAFRRAVAMNAARATEVFLSYPTSAPVIQIEHLRTLCKPERKDATANLTHVLELEDFLAIERTTLSEEERDERRYLEACLVRTHLNQNRFEPAMRRLEQIMNSGGVSDLRFDDQVALASVVLAEERMVGDWSRSEMVKELLMDIVRPWSASEADIRAAHLCPPQSTRYCAGVLDSLTLMHPSSYFLPLYSAVNRAEIGRKEDALVASNSLRTALERLRDAADVTATERTRLETWITFGQGLANIKLANHGARDSLPAATRQLKTVLQRSRGKGPSDGWPDRGWVFGSLLDAYTMAGQFDSVLAAPRLNSDVGSGLMWSRHHFAYLAAGKLDSATRIADSIYSLAPNDWNAQFVAALTRIVAMEPDAPEVARRFIHGTSHQYRDLIRMAYYWYLNKAGGRKNLSEARSLLEDRFDAIDTTTWTGRLSRRDQTAWYEMLIYVFRGERDAERLFSPLSSDSLFVTSDLADLAVSRDALLCERHFYLALLKDTHGKADEFRIELDRVLATRYTPYYEYHMARLLRERIGR